MSDYGDNKSDQCARSVGSNSSSSSSSSSLGATLEERQTPTRSCSALRPPGWPANNEKTLENRHKYFKLLFTSI